MSIPSGHHLACHRSPCKETIVDNGTQNPCSVPESVSRRQISLSNTPCIVLSRGTAKGHFDLPTTLCGEHAQCAAALFSLFQPRNDSYYELLAHVRSEIGLWEEHRLARLEAFIIAGGDRTTARSTSPDGVTLCWCVRSHGCHILGFTECLGRRRGG